MRRLKPGPKPRPLADRFWEKVDKRGTCWLWTAYRDRDGYGKLQGRHGEAPMHAHHVAIFLTKGRWPKQMVLHKCDNPSCVRPSHLFEGTAQDNSSDMVSKGRTRAPRGEKNGRSKLTKKLVRVIRTSTETQAALARRIGVHQSTISLVRSRRTWRAA